MQTLGHFSQQAGRCPVRLSSRRHAIVLRAQPQKGEETDLVTRMVGKIFGQGAVDDPTPFGLKRMDWSQIKDLEVTLDRDAELLPSDLNSANKEMQLIRPLLGGTQLEAEPLKQVYDADKDGWNWQAFHEKVDGFGATVVYAKTVGGAILGGYNPLGFDGYGEKATMGAFLFGWPNGDTKQKPYKLPKVTTDQMAIADRMEAGPQFGPGDLKILLLRGAEKKVQCKLVDYARPPNKAKTLFNTEAGETSTVTQLAELKVFVRRGGKLKYELDGLRWKSSLTKEDDEGGQGPPPGIFTM